MTLAGEEGSVEFTLSEADFIAAATLPSFAAATGDRRRILISVVAAMVGMIAVAMGFHPSVPGAGWVAALAVYLLRMLTAPMPLRRLGVSPARRVLATHAMPPFVRPQRVCLSPSGIVIAGGVGESHTAWSSVRGIVSLPQGLVFFSRTGPAPSFRTAASPIRPRVIASRARGRRLHAQAAASGESPAIPSRTDETGGFSFTLSLDDLVAFQYFVHRRSFARRHQRFISCCVAVPALLGFMIAYNRADIGWPDAEESLVLVLLALFIAGLAVVLWYGDPWLDCRLYRSIARGREDDLGPVQVATTREGLLVTNRAGRHLVACRSVIAIETGPGGAYLFTTPQQAHLVPRHAFASDAMFNDFVAAVRQRAGAVDRG